MKTVLHRADSRGYFDHGWLQTHHTFSFARYYDPSRVNFGALRVLNDDTVAPGEGFGTHPHDNMEVISIPLAGELRHGDSMRNGKVLRVGQIQTMSAGTGITHSEFNNREDRPVEFLQIWVFPREKHLTPRYGDFTLAPAHPNELRTIVTPDTDRADGAAWIHQDAWFSTLDLDKHAFDYQIRRPGNGLYIFVIEGEATVAGLPLGRRDGLGVSDTDRVGIETGGHAELLLMDVPM